jgi:hypothetical protein
MNSRRTHLIPFRLTSCACFIALMFAASIVQSQSAAPAPAEADGPSKKGELPFDLAGKVREKDGIHEFFIPHPKTFSVLILPGDPAKLCAELSPEGAARIKDLAGLEFGRYHIAGNCVPRSDGKPGHVITSIKTMMPLGDGVVRTEEIVIQGTLEVRGNPKAEDFLTKSDMMFHGVDGVDFRIPAKKFAGKPSGLTYQDAAVLNKQIIKMKAKAQFYRKGPHRIATIIEFAPVKK